MKSLAPGLPAAIIVLFVAIFLSPELIGGKVAATGSLSQWLPWSASDIASGPDGVRESETSFNPDCLTSYYPRRALFRQAWQDGEIPLWNPYSFCGTPFLADPQAQVLYPPSWILLLLDPAAAMGWFVFLHLAGAGIGAWLLLRRYGVGEHVALLGGCAFALNGFFVKHFGLPPFLATAAWIPWWILAIENAVDRPGLAAGARLAVVGALSFLAGQPQIALMMTYAGALHGLVRAATGQHRGSVGHWGRLGLTAIGASAVALLIVSAQLLPTLELAARSARARLPYETVLSGAFHPVDAIRFLVPEFFGAPMTRDEWSPLFPLGDSFYLRTQLNSVFAGTSVFLFALVGMLHPKTRRRALPFTVTFVVMSLVAFGGPLARLAHAFVPGFSFARLDRAGSLIVFAQLVPAGLAAAQLRYSARAARLSLGFGMVTAAAVGTGLVLLAGLDLPAWLGAQRIVPAPDLETIAASAANRTLVAAMFAVGAGLAWLLPRRNWVPAVPFAVAAIQLALLAAPYRGDRDPRQVFATTPEIERLRLELSAGDEGGTRFARFGRAGAGRAYPVSGILPPSTNAPHGLRDLQGYNALTDRRLGDALELATGEPMFSHGIWTGRRIVAPDEAGSLEHPLFDALSVGFAVATRPIEADGWSALPDSGSFTVARNSAALPRVRLVSRGRGVSPDEMARLLESGDLRPADEVLWISAPGSEPTTPIDPGADAATDTFGAHVEILSDSWNRLAVRTHSEKASFLVVADSHDIGWHATVDGEPTPILAAWGLVRAVPMAPGGHLVEMNYRPASFRRGCVLSVLGLLLVGTALATSVPGRRGGATSGGGT